MENWDKFEWAKKAPNVIPPEDITQDKIENGILLGQELTSKVPNSIALWTTHWITQFMEEFIFMARGIDENWNPNPSSNTQWKELNTKLEEKLLNSLTNLIQNLIDRVEEAEAKAEEAITFVNDNTINEITIPADTSADGQTVDCVANTIITINLNYRITKIRITNTLNIKSPKPCIIRFKLGLTSLANNTFSIGENLTLLTPYPALNNDLNTIFECCIMNGYVSWAYPNLTL